MLEDDIARVDNSINYTPLNSNVSNAWKRIKKKLEEAKKPSTNKARDAICVNEKCHWNLNGVCAFVSCCPGRNK